MSPTLITSTDPKGIRAASLFQAKYNKAKLDDDAAQRLNEDPEFWAGVEKLINERSRPNQFASEEVRSSYGYPEGYRVKPILEQVAILKGFFPNLATNDEELEELTSRPLPTGADGWFAIPRPEKISVDYNLALMKV